MGQHLRGNLEHSMTFMTLFGAERTRCASLHPLCTPSALIIPNVIASTSPCLKG